MYSVDLYSREIVNIVDAVKEGLRSPAMMDKRWYIAAAVPDDIRMSAAPSRMMVKSGSP